MFSFLPNELIWTIVDLGKLDLEDLIALSMTCKLLNNALSDRLPWISVGRRMQEQGFALPVPSFRTMESLSLQELKEACVRAKKTKKNLESESPDFRKHSNMAFEEGVSILTSGFLPGGRYLLTFSSRKLAQIWDIEPLLAGNSSMQTTPKPLATHPTDAAPVTCNFQTRERVEWETIVAGAVENQNGLSIHVFTFVFGEKEDQRFIAKDLCRTPPLHNMHWPSLGIYGDVALVVGSSHETGFLTIVLLDYRRQALYVMDSGIVYHEEMSFEAFIHENDLVTYTPIAEGVVFSIWFDALGLLNSPTATSWSTIHTYSVPPDSTKVWFFENRCQFTECELWYPSRPWNTPSPRTFGLIPSHLTADWAVDASNFAPEGSSPSRLMLCPFVTPYWLEPAHVTRLMKDDGPLPSVYRTALPLRTTSFWPSLDEAFPLMTPSSCGQHIVWVTSGGTDLDPQNESVYPDVQLIHLPSAEDHSNRTAAVPYARRLVLPLDLNKVHRIDFCDETGLLAVICLGDLPSSPQMLHVFRY